MVFFGFVFFEVLILKGLFLVCLPLFQKVLKMLVFPSVLGFFGGWFILLYILDLEGLGVFVFLVFVFVFMCCFCFCFVCFWFVGGLFFGVGSCFDFVFFVVLFLLFFLFFLFFFFCFFWSQVRWPKGPPHLALNPPYFLFRFVFFF